MTNAFCDLPVADQADFEPDSTPTPQCPLEPLREVLRDFGFRFTEFARKDHCLGDREKFERGSNWLAIIWRDHSDVNIIAGDVRVRTNDARLLRAALDLITEAAP